MSIKEAIIKKFLGKKMYHPFLITDSDTATVFPTQDEFSVSAEYMIEKYIKGSIDIGTGKDAINIYQDMKAIKELYPQLDEIRSNFE